MRWNGRPPKLRDGTLRYPDMQKAGTGGRSSRSESRFEAVETVAVRCIRIAAGQGHAGEIHQRRHGCLSAGAVMDTVVEQDVDQVRRAISAYGCKRSQLHQRGAITVEHDDRTRGGECKPEPHP